MKYWLNKNFKALIITAFLIPIITVAIVSISHVTKWYGISNPVTWSVYLSIGIEIAALSALAAISANMGRKVYFPFAIVTLIQFIGNVFFAYAYIDINSKEFINWVDLVSPLTELLGVDPSDLVGNKRLLAFFAGGMLPIISLSFLHMLVKFTEEDRKKEEGQPQTPDQLKDFVDETTRIRLSENDFKTLEEALLNSHAPNENLIRAAEKYKYNFPLSDEDILKRAESIQIKKTFERMEKIEAMRESLHGSILPEDEPVGALANSEYREEKERKLQEILDKIGEEERIQKEKQDILDNTIDLFDQENEKIMEDFVDNVIKNNSEIENGKWVDEEKLKQRELLIQMMQQDQELGLYDEPFDNPLVKEPSNSPQNASEMMLTTNSDIIESIPSDDEISDWDVTLMDGLEDEEPFFTEDELVIFFQEKPTIEDESGNFSTIEPNTDNIFQEEYSPPLSGEEIMNMNQNEYERNVNTEEESLPKTITIPFEPILLPNELVNEQVVEQTPIGQTEDLTDEKKN